MPRPRVRPPQRSVGQSAAGRARQIGRAASRYDIDFGPFEVALGTVIGIFVGMLAGFLPALLFRSGVLVVPGMVVGAVGGWLLSRRIRNRLTIHGWRMGVVGVILLSIPTLCIICATLGSIARLQNQRAALEIFRRQKEMGITIPKAAEEILSQSQPSLWERLAVPLAGLYAYIQQRPLLLIGVTWLGAMAVVISVVALVGLLIYGIRRRRSW